MRICITTEQANLPSQSQDLLGFKRILRQALKRMFCCVLPVIMKMESIKRRCRMKRTKQIIRGVGKVMLALTVGILMPILLWVALGVAVYQKVHVRRLQRELAPTTGEILRAAGLTT